MPVFTLTAAGMIGQSGAAGLGEIKINGLLQDWYVSGQKAVAKDGFSVRRAEIKLSGKAHPLAGWFVTIDPAKPVNIKTTAQGGNLTAA